MKYCVVKDSDQMKFEAEVNNLIMSGWEPFGSVSVSSVDDIDVIAQAMVFIDETDIRPDNR